MTNEEAIKSEQNGKVCCNCRHFKRKQRILSVFVTTTVCVCDIDEQYLGYEKSMTHWCRHWAKEKAKEGAEE